MCIVTKNAVMKQLQVAGVLAAVADWSSGTADMASSTAAPIIPNAIISSTDRIARAHQASFCARGLLKIIAVSEKGAGAHGNVPRAGGCSTDGPAGRGVGDSTCKGVARNFPSASVMTEGPVGPSTQCAYDRPSLPDPVGYADYG